MVICVTSDGWRDVNPATAKRLQRLGFAQIIKERGPDPVKHPTELPDIKEAPKHPGEPDEPALPLADAVVEPVKKPEFDPSVAKNIDATVSAEVDPEPSPRESQTYTNRKMETERPALVTAAPSKLVTVPTKAKAPVRKKRASKAETTDDGNILE